MSAQFQKALTRAIEDEAFGRSLQTNPTEALQAYQLSAEQVAELKMLSPAMLAILRQREKGQKSAWRMPTNFRESGAAVLSAVLLVLMLFVAYQTMRQINAVPLTYEVGGNVQVVDTFDRAKDLLNIFFPLFGAVVTFWLGVTVEGRRADRNAESAEIAKEKQESAEAQAQTVTARAQKAIASAQKQLLGADASSRGGLEMAGPNETRGTTADRSTSIRDAMRILTEAQHSLLDD